MEPILLLPLWIIAAFYLSKLFAWLCEVFVQGIQEFKRGNKDGD